MKFRIARIGYHFLQHGKKAVVCIIILAYRIHEFIIDEQLFR